MLNSPKKRGVVGSRGAGCGGAAGWGNPSQAVALAAGLFVNLPSFGFPPLFSTPSPGSKYSCLCLMCIHKLALRPYLSSFFLKIVFMLAVIRDAIRVTVNV